ncbi:MAG: hypothetical protein CMJ64_03545 [Planctomycetaceae bacterium]|nr:hypothetical protein [Planctomycetaceae bacterium]
MLFSLWVDGNFEHVVEPGCRFRTPFRFRSETARTKNLRVDSRLAISKQTGSRFMNVAMQTELHSRLLQLRHEAEVLHQLWASNGMVPDSDSK